MDSILQIARQEDVEKRFNRKHIDGYIREAIDSNVDTHAQMEKGFTLLTHWLEGSYYASKQARLNQLKGICLRDVIKELFVGIAYVQQPELFTSVTAQLAGRLDFDDKRDAIATVAEMLAVLCQTDAFDITKKDRMASLMVVSRLHLPEELVKFINESMYLPPMVCEPLELKGNYDSGYLSHKDSLILGKGNHHNGNICLDVLNTMNKVALRLDTDFLKSVEEEPGKDFTIEGVIEHGYKKGKYYTEAEAALILNKWIQAWPEFKSQSTKMYLLIHNLGNEFYLTHKVDKRGRIYSQGYHISTQGTAFKKAMIELADEELVEGVFA